MSVETEPTQAVTRRGPAELDRVARLGMWLAAAESGSKDPKALGMAAALRIEYVQSLGFPAHAAAEIHQINGNLSLSAKMCRAMAPGHGLRVVRAEETKDSCTAAVVEIATGRELGRTTYTLAQARQQGLSGKNWTTVPDRMLWARASKRALDDHAPWVTVGVVTREEFEDAGVLEPEPEDTVLTGEVVDPDDAIPFGEPA